MFRKWKYLNKRLEYTVFDGRKNRTKTLEYNENREHYILVRDIYITLVIKDNGRAPLITDEMLLFIIDSNSKSPIKAVLCDGTTLVNTEKVGRVLKIMKIFLEKPWQWLIFLLDDNEFPFRYI